MPIGFIRDLLGTGEAQEAAANAAMLDAAGFEAAGDVLGVAANESANRIGAGVREGSNIAARGQQQAIDFLSDRERLPITIRDQALQGLANFYEMPTQPKTQAELIAEARQSPLYSAILSNRGRGEDAILRNAAATGGLRSGATINDLAEFNTDLENQALLTGFQDARQMDDYRRMLNLQGITGLTNLQGNEAMIADLMAGRGATLGTGYAEQERIQGQGDAAAAQARADAILGSTGAHSGGQLAAAQIGQQGTQNAFDTLLGGLSGFANVGGIPGIRQLFCDIRLKSDIRFLAVHNGINFYGWEWNDRAAKLGLTGPCSGVMAHEIYELHPEACGEKDGFVTVHYDKIPELH